MVKQKLFVLCVLLIRSQIIEAANLFDFCDYRNKLVESNVGYEIPILRSRISSSTFSDFVSNKTFKNLFQNVFHETITNEDIEWTTNIDQMYMVPLNRFIPQSLGCIYKLGYRIKSFSNKTTIDIPGLVQAISEEVYEEIIKNDKDSELPVVVLQGSSMRESVFCVFGTLYKANTYFFVQCLFEPSIGMDIPKFIKITEQLETGGKAANDRVLCFSHFPKYCANYNKLNQNKITANEIEPRVALVTVKNQTIDTESATSQIFNISNVPDSFKQLFRNFYCYNCTINIQVKN